jgi:hypothetical protein
MQSSSHKRFKRTDDDNDAREDSSATSAGAAVHPAVGGPGGDVQVLGGDMRAALLELLHVCTLVKIKMTEAGDKGENQGSSSA